MPGAVPGPKAKPVRAAGLLAVLAVGACASFPQMDARVDPSVYRQPYPAIVPFESFEAGTGEGAQAPNAQADLAARLRALRLRAARLRGPVIDRQTRRRMEAGASG